MSKYDMHGSVPDWAFESALLEGRIEALEERENVTAWVIVILSITVAALAAKVVGLV